MPVYDYETPSASLTEDMPVFVEIKQRVDRVTQKRRVILPYGKVFWLCSKRQYPEQVAAEDEAAVDEIYAFVWQYNLCPTSIVRDDRTDLQHWLAKIQPCE